MRYLPTINLWDRATNAAIKSGQLKLQRGQWVQCGEGKKSRWVGIKSSGAMWAAHWQGDAKSTARRFKVLCEAYGS